MSAAMCVHNFEFIRHEQPALASLLREAEMLLGDDSCCFLLKIRLALELWCHDFADLHGLQLALETTLAEKLEILSSQKVFPADLLQQLMQLRQHTNQAVHIQQDLRGRHMTMQPLERVQQVSILQCLFELVSYTKRFQQPDSELPVWLPYPKQNLRVLLTAAFDYTNDIAAAGQAAVQLAQAIQHQLAQQKRQQQSDTATLTDLQYWLERGLRLGSSAALNMLSELVFAKQYPSFDLPMLSQWIQRYQQQQPSMQLDYLHAQLLERQHQLDKALKSYQKAADAGHHAAIKRLLEYWASRDQQQLQHYLQLGVKFNEPFALLSSMALVLVDVSKATAADLPAASLKTLKGYLVKARAMSIAGLGYIEGMCHHLGILGYAQDDAIASQLVQANYQKVPSYCKAAVNTFYLLLSAQQHGNAVSIASRAMAQLDENRDRDTLAELEFDIAMALLKLHELKTPVPFVKTPQQLLQSAAKRGYNNASLFLNSHVRTISKLAKRNTLVVPGWAKQLAARGARVSACVGNNL